MKLIERVAANLFLDLLYNPRLRMLSTTTSRVGVVTSDNCILRRGTVILVDATGTALPCGSINPLYNLDCQSWAEGYAEIDDGIIDLPILMTYVLFSKRLYIPRRNSKVHINPNSNFIIKHKIK